MAGAFLWRCPGCSESALWAVDGTDTGETGAVTTAHAEKPLGCPWAPAARGHKPQWQVGWALADHKQHQEGGAQATQLQPALPRILPTRAVASQTLMSSPLAPLMLAISPEHPHTLNSSEFIIFPELPFFLGPHPQDTSPPSLSHLLSHHQSLVSNRGPHPPSALRVSLGCCEDNTLPLGPHTFHTLGYSQT